MTYAALKTEVKDWIHRSDLDGKMDSFVLLAEAMINEKLRVLENETRLDIVFDDQFYTLPADYNQMRSLKLEKGKVPIKQVSILQLEIYRKANQPIVYAIHSGQVEFSAGIDPTNPFNGEIIYYADVPPLVSNTTNAVLDKYPLLYQAAMLFYANGYVQDTEQEAKWLQVYSGQINKINNTSRHYVAPQVRAMQ